MAGWTVYLSFCLLLALNIDKGSPYRKSCKSGWSEFKGRCFYFFNTPKPWIEAEKFCLAHDGNLASVHSLEEYSFIQRLIYSKNHASTVSWIGGSDGIKEGTWLWSDGSKMDLQHWETGEPYFLTAYKEDCLGVNYGTSSNWNDYECHWAMPFVCAKK